VSGAAHDDEDFLLALLNTTPTVDGRRIDQLADDGPARRWVAGHLGEPAADADPDRLRRTRDTLQRVIHGEAPGGDLAEALAGVVSRPEMGEHGVTWVLDAPAATVPSVRAVLAWDALERSGPGRLRYCANPECSLFLIDRSKSGNARWCSMSTCGNRMKARRHHGRSRAGSDGG
jgi:hypothetical protein